MASPPTLTPGSTTFLNRQAWMDTVEAPTFQQTEFINSIREFPGKIYTTGNVRKFGRVLGSTFAQSTEGLSSDITAQDPSATPVTITAGGKILKTMWSLNEKAQVDIDLANGLGGIMISGMAETIDQAGLAAVTSLTQTMSQAAVDATMWRQAVGRLQQNTNGAYAPGENRTIKAIFSPTQYPALMAIDEFTHADVRGDTENPQVKGVFTKGGGVNVRFSTVVTLDANGWHNPLYVEDTFIIGWNQHTNSFEHQDNAHFYIVCFANFGVSVLHDLRGIDMRLTASQL